MTMHCGSKNPIPSPPSLPPSLPPSDSNGEIKQCTWGMRDGGR